MTLPAPAPLADAVAPRSRRPALRRALPPLVVAGFLAVVAVLCAAMVPAYGYLQRTHTWLHSVGPVVAHPYGDQRGPGVVYYDTHGNRRVLLLAPNDTDDLPVGSLGYVVYDPAGPAADFSTLPREKLNALEQLAGLFLAGAAAGAVWWRVDRRRLAAPRDGYVTRQAAAA